MEDYKPVKLWWEQHIDEPGFPPDAHTSEKIYPRPLYKGDDLFSLSPCPRQEIISPASNRFIYGDNLQALNYLLHNGGEGTIDLIYIDPPFLSESHYSSRIEIGDKDSRQVYNRQVFTDSWNHGLHSYLDHIYPRLKLMKDLLKNNGSIFVHLDWHVSHYVKLLLDDIFGPASFINEIVWCYGGGSGAKRHFHRKHDVILWYAKGHEYLFNPQYRPYTEGTRKRGLTRVKGDKYHLKVEGAFMQDWWADINKILSPTAYENLKYPTQKPVALLRRIVMAASQPGSLVADFYCGSGTLADVCDETGRNWIACDNSPVALCTTMQRLIRRGAAPFSVCKMQPEHINGIDNLEVRILQMKPDLYKLIVNLQNSTFHGDSPDRSLSFWALDLDHSPGHFFSDLQMVREKHSYQGHLATEIALNVLNGGNFVGVKAYDFWGQEYYGMAAIR